MPRKNDGGAAKWVDPDDDLPELTVARLETAAIYRGETLVRRGRPPTGRAKTPVSVRMDADLLAALRARGPGWQLWLNATLRRNLGLPEHQAVVADPPKRRGAGGKARF